jgi:hypothetical protein
MSSEKTAPREITLTGSVMKQRLPEYKPLDLRMNKVEITDPVIAAYYHSIFLNVSYRYENGKVIFTIDIDAMKKSFSDIQIESHERELQFFISSYNRHMGFLEYVAEFGKAVSHEAD